MAPLETRESGRFPRLDAAEERLLGLVQPRQHLLQDLQ